MKSGKIQVAVGKATACGGVRRAVICAVVLAGCAVVPTIGAVLLAGVPDRGGETRTVQAQAVQTTGPALPEGARSFRNIEYVSGGHERQKLDLYVPAKGAGLPLVVWVHGGAWLAGNKDSTRAT